METNSYKPDSTTEAGKGILRSMGLDHLSGRQKFSLTALLGWIAAWLFDPFITVFRLNVENIATDYGFNRIYGWPAIAEFLATIGNWIGTVYDYLTGPFGLGFVVGAVVFAFWDPVAKRIWRTVYGHVRVGNFNLESYVLTGNPQNPDVIVQLCTTLHNDSADAVYFRLVRGAISLDGRINPNVVVYDQAVLTILPGKSQGITVAGIPHLPRKQLYAGNDELVIEYGPSSKRLIYRLEHEGHLTVELHERPDQTVEHKVQVRHRSVEHSKI